MRFPVPQFTDVEDKIIGGLSIKQFGILFGAGVVMFLGYSASKSVLILIFLFFLFGVPALVLAFAKINGRTLYSTFPIVFQYLTSPKFFIFDKEARFHEIKIVTDVQAADSKPIRESTEDRKKKLLELQIGLSKASDEREDILRKK